MNSKTRIGLLSAGMALVAGIGILLLSSDKGRKWRKQVKRKAEDFFDETDDLIAKARKKYAEMEQRFAQEIKK